MISDKSILNTNQACDSINQKSKLELIEDALLKNVSGGKNTCNDSTGTDVCFDGVCWGKVDNTLS